jgi:type IV secretion system protein VirB6
MDFEAVFKKLRYILIAIIFVLALMILITFFLLILGSFGFMNGACWYRYALDSNGFLSSQVMASTKQVTLRADANPFRVLVSDGSQTGFKSDPAKFGSWQDAGTLPQEEFELEIKGSVSLCKSYVPRFNLQTDSADAKQFEIPRVDEQSSFQYIFNSRDNSSWRNVAEIFPGDLIKIFVSPVVSQSNIAANQDLGNVAIENHFDVSSVNGEKKYGIIRGDCRSSAIDSLAPFCGRYTFYKDQLHLSGCSERVVTTCDRSVCHLGIPGASITNFCYENYFDGTNCIRKGCYWACSNYDDPNIYKRIAKYYDPIYTQVPLDYAFNGSNTFTPQLDNSKIAQHYYKDYKVGQCNSINPTGTNNDRKLWLTQGDGVFFGYFNDVALQPFSVSSGGARYIPRDQPSDSPFVAPGKMLFINTIISSDLPNRRNGYLKLSLLNMNNDASKNRGGYLINVQHTKCRRLNGQSISDTVDGRGAIEYKVLPAECDLNQINEGGGSEKCKNALSQITQKGILDFNQASNIKFIPSIQEYLKWGDQKLWLRIKNHPDDYKDSIGEYTVDFKTKENVGQFTKLILPIFEKVDEIIENAGQNVFKNLTCYKYSNQSPCFNFFGMLRGFLTLYIMYIGFSFLLGKSSMNQTEFLIHSSKIIIIAGLMNGKTFEFFNGIVFPMVMGFTDQIMANFGGYSNVNPFTFLDEILGRIFLSPLGLFQILSMIGTGVSGFVFLMVTIAAILLFIIATFQAIATYLFAKLLVAFLLGLTPLFLVALLFPISRVYFQNWINNVFRYTIEPVVVLIGLSILSKLFLFYYDAVLGYSVCFKCAIPFKIPNLFAYFLPGFPDGLKSIYIFCLQWFAPWGTDGRNGLIGLPIPDIVGLFLVAYICFTYVSMSGAVVSSLTGSMGPGASEAGAAAGTDMLTKAKNATVLAAKASYYAGSAITKKLSGGRGANISDSQGASGGDKSGDTVQSRGGIRAAIASTLASIDNSIMGNKEDSVDTPNSSDNTKGESDNQEFKDVDREGSKANQDAKEAEETFENPAEAERKRVEESRASEVKDSSVLTSREVDQTKIMEQIQDELDAKAQEDKTRVSAETAKENSDIADIGTDAPGASIEGSRKEEVDESSSRSSIGGDIPKSETAEEALEEKVDDSDKDFKENKGEDDR